MLLKKNILQRFLLLSILSSCYSTFSSWEMVEDIFITKPELEMTSIKSRIARWGITALAGLGSYFGATKITEKTGFGANLCFPKTNIKVFPMASAGAGSLLIYAFINEFYRQAIEHRIMRNFLNDWPNKRTQTPWQLHQPLDNLYAHYKNQSSKFDEEAYDVMRLIKAEIYNHFPSKYRSMVSKDFFNSRFFNANMTFDFGGVLRGLADIIREMRIRR